MILCLFVLHSHVLPTNIFYYLYLENNRCAKENKKRGSVYVCTTTCSVDQLCEYNIL